MSMRHIRGPLVFNTYKIITTGNYTVLNESLVIVNKTVGAATGITLPPSGNVGGQRAILIVDGKGDSATNNITLTAAGTDVINGAATLVIGINYSLTFLVDLGGGFWEAATFASGGNVTFSGLTLTGPPTFTATDGITAFSTGGQTSAVPLPSTINTVDTVAAAGDSVKLPLAAPGAIVFVTNLGANSCNIFPFLGDKINALAINAAIELTPGASLFFTSTVALKWDTMTVGIMKPAQFNTMNVTTGTLAAGQASGAEFTTLFTTNATPGSQAMRTPAQILSDTPGLFVGGSYILRIINSGAGTLTLATDSGAGFTMTGTMTVATNTFRDWCITINTATTGTVQNVGAGDI